MTDQKRFSRLMLGTVQFGLRYGIANTSGKPDLDQVEAIVRAAADGGITALDTAAAYGDSEQVLGLVLQRAGLAGQFTVVSKIPPLPAEAGAGRCSSSAVITNSAISMAMPSASST